MLPYAAFVEMAMAAAGAAGDGRALGVRDLRLHRPVVLADAEPTRIQSVLDADADGAWRFRVYTYVGSAWTLVSSARVAALPGR